MEIRKKTWPKYFNEVKSGNKTFDYRLADWQANEGDTLILEEWDPETKDYTGNTITKTIGYVLNLKDLPSFSTKEQIEKYGHMIISLKD
jgi:ASC-1-like (ASCH) protein